MSHSASMAGVTTGTSVRATAPKVAEKTTRDKPDAQAPGIRLAEAIEAVERFPVLVESRERVTRTAAAKNPQIQEVVEAVESDVGLAISVLRFANRGDLTAGGVAGIPAAVELVKPSGVSVIAATAPSFDFFELGGGWEPKPERFRLHALATRQAADQIGRAVGWAERDELMVASLLHDVGRLAVSRLHPDSNLHSDAGSRDPGQRLGGERSRLRIDHALVGGVLARRWNLPQRIAVAIERHHTEDTEGLAALVSAADMVAHYRNGDAISPERLVSSCERVGLTADALRDLLYETTPAMTGSNRISEPCPLSARELDVVRHLSAGLIYKQIATEMHLSPSTIRSHLHSVYGKIGARDRAQAVLAVRDRGWI